jgi:hypothetical protein
MGVGGGVRGWVERKNAKKMDERYHKSTAGDLLHE